MESPTPEEWEKMIKAAKAISDKERGSSIEWICQMGIMNSDLRKFMTSLLDKPLTIDIEKRKGIKELSQFKYLILSSEKNLIDYIRIMDFSQRKSTFFTNVASLHTNALKSKDYISLYNKVVDLDGDLNKKLNDKEHFRKLYAQFLTYRKEK